MVTKKKKQLGAFLMARWVLLMLILVAMLVIPIWLKRNSDDKLKALTKAEAAVNAKGESITTAAADVAVAPIQADRPIGFGLTFAAVSPASPQPDVIQMSCHGLPAPTDKPNKDTCNPYQGDTSCRAALPVLCLNPNAVAAPDAANGDSPAGWTSATLGSTAPVMGAILQSRSVADARCEKELGKGWRMADFHAGGGWSFSGRPGQGMLSSSFARYWVAIDDQPANCWDSKP